MRTIIKRGKAMANKAGSVPRRNDNRHAEAALCSAAVYLEKSGVKSMADEIILPMVLWRMRTRGDSGTLASLALKR